MNTLMNEVMDNKIQLRTILNNNQLLTNANFFEVYQRFICSRGQPKDGLTKHYKCLKIKRKKKRRKKIILKFIG